MFQRFVVCVLFAVLAVPSFARDVLIPVVTGTAGNRTFRTTVVVVNRTNTAAECVFTYRSPGRPDHPFISREAIAAGQGRIYEDFLVEMSAAGTIRADCTAGVELVTRLQESSDGGKTFRTGRLFRPFLDDHVIKEGVPGTTRAATDVGIAEVTGKPVHVEVSATNFGGVEYAHAAYDVPPYALRIVSLAEVLQKLPATDVTVTVSGKGAVVIGKETREPALANVALHRTEVQQVVASSAPPSSSVIAMLGISPFKGAPFVEPMTGDIYMRDRWYNPHTGTFLSPDPMGYADSPNLYTYCSGDPINCSDATGRAASVSKSGVIIGIRPDSSRYRIERGTDPVDALRILESDADIRTGAEQEDVLTRARMAIPYSSACRAGEYCIGSATPNNRAYTHERRGGRWGYAQGALMAGANMLTAPGAVLTGDSAYVGFEPRTREQQIGAGATNLTVAAVGTTAAFNQFSSARAQLRGALDDPTINADPAMLRYSQRTAGSGRAEILRSSMQANGWRGAAIDAVMTDHGLVTLDNTRPAVAFELGMQDIPVRVHMPDEPLPPEMLGRRWNRLGQTAKTWGEAAKLRAAAQDPAIGPTGIPAVPKLMYGRQ